MTDEALLYRPLRADKIAIAFAGSLYIAWSGAWVLERWLEHQSAWLTSADGQFVYWLTMKLLLWVIPAVLIIKLSQRRLLDVLRVKPIMSVLLWGSGIGIVLVLMAVLTKVVLGRPIVSTSFGWPVVNAVIVAPMVEEITFRGAILISLQSRYRFWLANTMSAALFLGAHLPGWYFQGHLLTNLIAPFGGAVSIFMLGLVFGFVAHRSQSVAASMITHALNNLGSVL